MNCIFCNNTKEEIILENDLAYAVYDKYPVTKGHILIIPKNHSDTFFDTTNEEKMAILDLINELKKTIDKQYQPDGYNIGINCGKASGQTIMHTHIHLIPRYSGDVEDPKGGVRGIIKEKQKY